MKLSIITPTIDYKRLANFLCHYNAQDYCGERELVIVIESDNYQPFQYLTYPDNCKTIRSKQHFDYGCQARDLALPATTGDLVVFWDDDNIYFPNALSSLVETISTADIGVCRTHHLDLIIPLTTKIIPGDIDTMCFVLTKQLACKRKWFDGRGKYADYRYFHKLATMANSINHSDTIIGRHL